MSPKKVVASTSISDVDILKKLLLFILPNLPR